MVDSKKTYSTPAAEKIEFDFREQVVASGDDSGNTTPTLSCKNQWIETSWSGEHSAFCATHPENT